MNIPGDTGHPWRLNKFIEYQHKARSVAPPLLADWAKKLGLGWDNMIMLCWYHSLTYCEITAVYLSLQLPYDCITKQDVQEFWRDSKNDLVFGSARKYVKNMDWFVPLMCKFMKETRRQPFEWLEQISTPETGFRTPQTRYDAIYKHLSKWKYMGRFSIERFLEILVFFSEQKLIPLQVKSTKVDWKHGSNLTAGILNIYYKDDEALEFDKTGYIKDPEFVAEKSTEIYNAVLKEYPNQETKDFIVIISKICSFRNLFKGARYGGYHHDRQLEQLLHYKSVYPNEYRLWNSIFRLRKRIFAPELLGELGGWTGIRKERKKLFIERGLTGIETIG